MGIDVCPFSNSNSCDRICSGWYSKPMFMTAFAISITRPFQEERRNISQWSSPQRLVNIYKYCSSVTFEDSPHEISVHDCCWALILVVCWTLNDGAKGLQYSPHPTNGQSLIASHSCCCASLACWHSVMWLAAMMLVDKWYAPPYSASLRPTKFDLALQYVRIWTITEFWFHLQR